MDPNEALYRLRSAMRTGDKEEARDAIEALREWLRRGGFKPKGIRKGELARLNRGLRAERVRLTRQGYDSGGRYWGVGEPLYRVWQEDGELDEYTRAPSATAAKAKFRVNPVRHFPRTKRGRPKVDRAFTITLYGARDRKLVTKKVKVPREEARAMAKGYVGTKYRGMGLVQRVELDGPK